MRTQAASQRGQSISEFAIILGAIILACGAMSTYATRAVQGRIKATTDNVLAVRDEDVTGAQTQEMGIEASIPRLPLPGGMNPAAFTTESTMDGVQRYTRGSKSVTEDVVMATDGVEIYRELIGPTDPTDEADPQSPEPGSVPSAGTLGGVRARPSAPSEATEQDEADSTPRPVARQPSVDAPRGENARAQAAPRELRSINDLFGSKREASGAVTSAPAPQSAERRAVSWSDAAAVLQENAPPSRVRDAAQRLEALTVRLENLPAANRPRHRFDLGGRDMRRRLELNTPETATHVISAPGPQRPVPTWRLDRTRVPVPPQGGFDANF